MKENFEQAKLIQDITLLYELSLSIGQSLDLQENCNRFLKRLMARKNLAYTAVWIKETYLPDVTGDGASLVYTNPAFRTKETHLPLSHSLFTVLGEKPFLSVSATDEAFETIQTEEGLEEGTFAIFALGQIGLLKLFSFRQKTAFNQVELAQLLSVTAQFTLSLEGCLAHQRARREIKVRQQAEAKLQQIRDELEQRVVDRTAELNDVNEELIRLSHLKDDFLANMSHELRTPLNAILALAESLQIGTYGRLTKKQERSLRRLERSGRHLLALINDVLDVSKIEAGKFELHWELVSVPDICQASLQFIQQEARNKKLKVFTTFDQEVNVIRADKRRLKQILTNLLTNAIKFTPAEGRIGLEVMATTKGFVHITVWDNGIGIDPEGIDQLFSPFVQLDNSLTRRQEGTGLGLSLVKQLVERHHGSVSVESAVGKGSRFTIALPWQSNGNTIAPIESGTTDISRLLNSTSPFPTRRATILLAEDNPENAETTMDYLQSRGYGVILARNGRQAVDLAMQKRPSLILMDIQMPEIDGLEATKRIRADSDLADMPIIALTALAMSGDRERCLAAGANDYLSKPVSLRALSRAIETQLEGELEVADSVETATAAGIKPISTSTENDDSDPLILLVDDDEATVIAYRDAIEIEAYCGIIARSGEEAVEYAQAEMPALILMDVNMPNVDGLEATRRLRADARTAGIPIILASGLSRKADVERCLAAGANAYLEKPIGLYKLLETIGQFVRK